MPEGTREQQITAEQEIRDLEQRLEAKKRELAEHAVEMPPEKEVLRGVIQEKIEELRPSSSPTDDSSVPTPAVQTSLTSDQQKKADELRKKEREEQIKELIEFALARSIEAAVRVAQSATPYLLDELHDHLVDDYYDKLVALRKVKKL